MKSGKAMMAGQAGVDKQTVNKQMGIDREAIIGAALTMLDRQGLAACTPDAVATMLQIGPDELAQHFAGQRDLHIAMGEAIAQAPIDGPATGWRETLTRRAIAGRHAMLSRRDGGLLFASLPPLLAMGGTGVDCVPALCAAGFSLADARSALMLVDRFTIGWTLAEQGQPELADSQNSFEGQLEIVLAGVAAALPGGLSTRRDERLSRFQESLWVFLRDARESANISFARTAHVNELDRRILLLLQAQGPKTLAAISTANGVDKAQVSRAIKRMSEVSLLARTGIRSPIRLSSAGRQVAEKLLRLAELRNRELTFGISDEQIVTLFRVLDTLLARAIALFEQERKFVAANQGLEHVDFKDMVEEGLPDDDGVAIDRSRVLPPFITLCSYMLRGGALSHKRQTGLSNFENWVHTEVCRNPPISWPQLVLALYRDQSQAGRTVNHLIDMGLVARTGKPGRRHGFFAPTVEGQRIFEILEETARKRSEFLFQGITGEQLDSFMASFDILSHNAEVQVARERAIREMDRETD